MSSLAMSTPALNPFPPIKPKFDEANLGNVVYLIASDARLCDIPLSELTAAGVKIRHFGCASEFLNCVREDSAACIISDGTRKMPLPMMVPTTIAVA